MLNVAVLNVAVRCFDPDLRLDKQVERFSWVNGANIN